MDENYYRILVKRYMDKSLTNDELEVFAHLIKQGTLDKYLGEAMDEELGLTGQPIETPVHTIHRSSFLKWAAAAAIVFSLGASLYFIKTRQWHNSPLPVAATDTTKIINSAKFISKQILPDKSIIWMQPNTQISYASSFTGKKLREVKMEGEAFFEVTKDHAHPFVITTGKVLTRVWGTSFRIKAIAGKATQISVLTGKVSVSVPGNNAIDRASTALRVMLQPNQEATFAADKNELHKSEINPKTDMLIWQKSNLNFENNTLASVIQTLNKDYGVRVIAAQGELNHSHITADFNGKNLPDILLLICKAVHADYTMQGDTITISKNN